MRPRITTSLLRITNDGIPKPAVEGEQTEQPELTEEELKARYDAMVQQEKERQIERAKNNLIKSFGWIAIPLPVFCISSGG